MEKREIQRFIKRLRKACHAKNCKNYEDCPIECGCNKANLNLATGIMWDAAGLIEDYALPSPFKNYEGGYITLRHIYNIVELDTAICYHGSKFIPGFFSDVRKVLIHIKKIIKDRKGGK